MSEPIYECPHCSGTGRTDNGAECQFCHAPARTARAGAIDAPVTAEDFKDVKVYTSTRDLVRDIVDMSDRVKRDVPAGGIINLDESAGAQEIDVEGNLPPDVGLPVDSGYTKRGSDDIRCLSCGNLYRSWVPATGDVALDICPRCFQSGPPQFYIGASVEAILAEDPELTPAQKTAATDLFNIESEFKLAEPIKRRISDRFYPHYSDAIELLTEAEAIVVTDAGQTEKIERAREIWSKLIVIEKASKADHDELKQSALREGQMIDKVERTLRQAIDKGKAHLREQAEFVKREEAKRLDAIEAARTLELGGYTEGPLHFYNLRNISDADYQKILETNKAAFEARAAEAKRLAEEKAERDRLDAEEKERLRRENERLAAEKAESDRLAAAAQARERQAELERQQAEAELRLKREEDERLEAARKAEEHRLAIAPEREKLIAYLASIEAIQKPRIEDELLGHYLVTFDSDLQTAIAWFRRKLEAK